MVRRRRRVSRTFAEIAVLLALATGGLVGALSQRPTPTPLKPSQNPQGQPDQQRQDSSTQNQDATPAGPASIEQGNAAKDTGKPDNVRRDQDSPSANPWSVVNWSVVNAVLLALANAVVAIFSGLLYCVTRRQAMLFANQNRIMVSQSTLMSDQLKATQDSADAARDSADVAEYTLRITQRAYLTILDIRCIGIEPGRWPSLKLEIENTGNLPATITELCTVFTGSPLPTERPPLQWHAAPSLIGARRAMTLTTFSEEATVLSEIAVHGILNGSKQFHVYGAIKYNVGFPDVTGELGFAMTFDPTLTERPLERRFIAADAIGYNYSS
jgi:hypothetical protein